MFSVTDVANVFYGYRLSVIGRAGQIYALIVCLASAYCLGIIFYCPFDLLFGVHIQISSPKCILFCEF